MRRAGIPAARKRLGSTVHATALADLSAVDRTYQLALHLDEDTDPPAQARSPADSARRCTCAGRYRLRLIDAGVIEPLAKPPLGGLGHQRQSGPPSSYYRPSPGR